MMKVNIFLICILCILFFAAAVSVQAIQLGDKSTEASNFDEQENTYLSGSFSITSSSDGMLSCSVQPGSKYVNQEQAAVHNIDVTFSGLRQFIRNVTSGSSARIDLKARIPENLDSVKEEGKNIVVSAFKVADIICIVGGQTMHTEELFMQRKNMFELKKIYATYGGFQETLDDGDKVEQLKPGMNVDLEIVGENLYSDSDDIDLEMEVSVSFDDSDINYDEDEEFDISADDDESEIFVVELDDDDVEDKKYDGQVHVIGVDDYGAEHGEKWDITFDIEKEKNEISILSVEPSKTFITCDDRRIDLQVRIKNTGKNDEDDAILEVSIPGMTTSEKATFELDENDEVRRSFTVEFPKSLEAGKQRIWVKTYFRTSMLSTQSGVDISVPDCSPVSQQKPPQKVDVVEKPPVIIGDKGSMQTKDDSKVSFEERPGLSSQTYAVILMVLIIVLAVLIVGLLAFALRQR